MILVTGASGMLGRAAVTRFLQDGMRVRAHGRTSVSELRKLFIEGAAAENLEAAIQDFALLDADAALRLCEGCTTVIHSAGLVHQPKAAAEHYEQYNVKATQLFADAARSCGVRQFVFISSSSVYGNRATNMVSENEPLIGDTAYAASKIKSEEYLKTNPPAASTVVLRPALVFGEGDRGNMLSLIRQVLSGKYFLIGDGAARKSLIYSADIALAIGSLLKAPVPGYSVFNIANPEAVSIRRLSEEITFAAGKSHGLFSVPPLVVNAGASIANILLGKRSPLSPERLDKLTRENSVSVEAFKNKFNFVPQFDLQTALAREINWARATSLL